MVILLCIKNALIKGSSAKRRNANKYIYNRFRPLIGYRRASDMFNGYGMRTEKNGAILFSLLQNSLSNPGYIP
uniref:hypothetical protein n=1 Tax=Escherichia coli TaxID=562 RepID=UPI003D6622E1